MRDATVYVHFPWCLEKCPYCDFVSYKTERAVIPHERYADAILAELDTRLAQLAGAPESRRFISVFFGGGTPSLWPAESVGRVLDGLRARLAFAPDAEVTVECNPSSLTEGHARALNGVGVTRLSIGVQSLEDEDLRYLGRLHDAAGARRALADARSAGFARVSADLIYALPAQRPEDALPMADAIADLGVTHLSAYQLTIEPGTRFGELARRGRLPLADEGASAEAFLALDAHLEERGMRHYEISNFARPGHESRHNLGYWRGLEYLALGTGAYGFWRLDLPGEPARGVRYRNEVLPEKYMHLARTSGPALPIESCGREGTTSTTTEVLETETLVRERIMLGLRLAEGLDVEDLARELSTEVRTNERERSVDRLVRRGRLTIDGPRWRVPKAHWLFADGTAAELF